jgi:hypothetical protein
VRGTTPEGVINGPISVVNLYATYDKPLENYSGHETWYIFKRPHARPSVLDCWGPRNTVQVPLCKIARLLVLCASIESYDMYCHFASNGPIGSSMRVTMRWPRHVHGVSCFPKGPILKRPELACSPAVAPVGSPMCLGLGDCTLPEIT